jgi:hypothetical protein
MTLVSTYSGGSIRGWQSASAFPIYNQTDELLPNLSNPDTKQFGGDIQMSYNGNYLVVGQRDFTGPNFTSGTSYIYNRNPVTNDFDLQQQINPNVFPGTEYWFFGQSVSTDAVGSVVAIGAPGYKDSGNLTGATYIFTRVGTTWTEQTILLPNDANSSSMGSAIDMSYTGNMIAVGASDNQANNQSGAVFIFTGSGNTWTKTQKLKITPTANGQQFGTFAPSVISVSKDANASYIAIGAPGDFSGQGSVVIFNKSGNTYVQQQRIQRPTSGGGSNFGRSVAINEHGNILLVGCPDEGIAQAGKAFLYSRQGNIWSLQQTITPTSTNVNDAFGSTVSISESGNIAFVSDTNYLATANTTSDQGAVFVFEELSSFIQNQILIANNAANGDRFGGSLTCSSTANILAVGAQFTDTPNVKVDTGSVYIFNT